MLHELAEPCMCGLLFAASEGGHRSHYYERFSGGEAGFDTVGSYGGSVDCTCTLSFGTSSTRRAEAGMPARAGSFVRGTALVRSDARAQLQQRQQPARRPAAPQLDQGRADLRSGLLR